MGNGTKVALVALLILMVVVIARFVRDTSDEGDADVRAGVTRAQDAAKAKAPASGQTDASPVRTAGIGKQEKKPPVPVGSTGSASGSSGAGAGSVLGSGTPSSGGALVTSGAIPPGTGASGTNPSGPMSGTPRGLNDPTVRSPGSALPPSGSAPPSGSQRGPFEQGGPASKETPRVATASDLGPATSRGTDGSPSDVKTPLKPGLQRPFVASDVVQKPAGDLRQQDRTDVFPAPAGQKGATAPGGDVTRPGAPPVPDEGKKLAGDGPGSATGRTTASGFPKTHVIEKGESFWTLAERYYKMGSLWPQIEKANPGVKVLPGKTLTIPEPVIPIKPKRVAAVQIGSDPATEPGRSTHRDPGAAEPKKTPPATVRKSAPEGSEHATTVAREYRVQKGDTLSALARKFYRDARKSHLIEEANTNLRYQTLQEGTTITIPAEK